MEVSMTGQASRWIVAVGGASAVTGGLLFAVKGIAILITGNQPDFLFEAAPAFFAVATGSLGLQLRWTSVRASYFTLALAGAALVSALVSTWPAGGSAFGGSDGAVSSAFAVVAGFAPIIGLLMVGLAARRTRSLSKRTRTVSLVIGLGFIPLLVVGGILESVNERLLEVSLILLAGAWMTLGIAMQQGMRGTVKLISRLIPIAAATGVLIFIVVMGGALVPQRTQAVVDAVHENACSGPRKSDSPWNIQELYNCETQYLFIPYQLWTGAQWDGDKSAPCMHPSDKLFFVNFLSATTIRGPSEWESPLTGETVTIWSREKVSGSKTQYFTCHELGIGRVYDSRGPRHYVTGRCKFPAGCGWNVGERRECLDTSIEIIALSLDTENNLKDLTFKWWTGGRLDHIYRYAPDKGMTNAWPQ
jgi:hypothetical protein